MLDREQKGYALERGHLHLHPAWLQLRTADGQLIYVSLTAPYRITSDFVTAPAGGTCGGISLQTLLHYILPCIINSIAVSSGINHQQFRS